MTINRLCPKCKHEISLGQPSCPGCGAKLKWRTPHSGIRTIPTGAAGGSEIPPRSVQKPVAAPKTTGQVDIEVCSMEKPPALQSAKDQMTKPAIAPKESSLQPETINKSGGASSKDGAPSVNAKRQGQERPETTAVTHNVPADVRFLRFFSSYCLIALWAVLVIALIVFFVPVGQKMEYSSYYYGERSSSTVTLFHHLKFFLSFLGEGDGLDIRYWIAVAVNCVTLFAWSVYAKSVANEAANHSHILDLATRKPGASSGWLKTFSFVWKGLGILVGIASVVAAIKCLDLDLSPLFAVVLCLCCLLFCGTLAVFCWGMGCIFAMQAWSEGAAKVIVWIASEHFGNSDGADSVLHSRLVSPERAGHFSHLMK